MKQVFKIEEVVLRWDFEINLLCLKNLVIETPLSTGVFYDR